jgi:phage baseplate assembly protein W
MNTLAQWRTKLAGPGRAQPNLSSRPSNARAAKIVVPNQQKDWLGRGWAYPVNLDPMTGGVAVAEYEADIRQAIEIILGTAPGERVMRPDFGCGIHELVFDAMDSAMLTRVETAVTNAMVTYEPRIEVLSVQVNPLHSLDGVLLIELQYRVRRTNQKDNMVYPFYFREGGPAQVEGSRG